MTFPWTVDIPSLHRQDRKPLTSEPHLQKDIAARASSLVEELWEENSVDVLEARMVSAQASILINSSGDSCFKSFLTFAQVKVDYNHSMNCMQAQAKMRKAAREEELEVEDADKFIRESEEQSEEGRNNRRGRGRGKGRGKGRARNQRSKGDDSSKASKDDDRSKADAKEDKENKVSASSPSKTDKPKNFAKGSPFFEREKQKRAMRNPSMSSLEVNPPTEPSPKKPRRAARKSKAKPDKTPERKDLGKEFEAAANPDKAEELENGEPAPKRMKPTPKVESCYIIYVNMCEVFGLYIKRHAYPTRVHVTFVKYVTCIPLHCVSLPSLFSQDGALKELTKLMQKDPILRLIPPVKPGPQPDS